MRNKSHEHTFSIVKQVRILFCCSGEINWSVAKPDIVFVKNKTRFAAEMKSAHVLIDKMTKDSKEINENMFL